MGVIIFYLTLQQCTNLLNIRVILAQIVELGSSKVEKHLHIGTVFIQ